MKINSPSLPELHAFLAVARLGSVQRAAEFLCVTSGAVSRALQRLEEHLGLRIFERHRRGTELTEVGHAYFSEIAAAVDLIEAATTGLQGKDSRKKLRLAVAPTFASHWLIPRLPAFHARCPDVVLSFGAHRPSGPLFDVDAAIRWSTGEHEDDLESEYLTGRELVAICTPSYLSGSNIQTAADLQLHPLIYGPMQPDMWAIWFNGVGIDSPTLKLTHGFHEASHMIEGALAGLGLCLIQECFVDKYLKSGRLVKAWPTRVANRRAHYLVYSSRAKYMESFIAFRDWILLECQSESVTNGV